MKAVSNAGPVIHLSWIDQLDLLRELFEEVIIPEAVRDEVLSASGDVPGLLEIRTAIVSDQLLVRAVTNRSAVASWEGDLHQGESEAIVLMQEVGADLLLLDDRRARARAQARGLAIAGTVGILKMARDGGLIQSVWPVLGQLQRLGFRISPAVMEAMRHEEDADH